MLLISRGDPMVSCRADQLAFLLVAAGLLLVPPAPAIRVRHEEALKDRPAQRHRERAVWTGR